MDNLLTKNNSTIEELIISENRNYIFTNTDLLTYSIMELFARIFQFQDSLPEKLFIMYTNPLCFQNF